MPLELIPCAEYPGISGQVPLESRSIEGGHETAGTCEVCYSCVCHDFFFDIESPSECP